MSDNRPDPRKSWAPGYEEARQAALECADKVKALGWMCHMGYNGNFFLETQDPLVLYPDSPGTAR